MPRTSGFSIIIRLRDMERTAKKTIYVEHIFVTEEGKITHLHVKVPSIGQKHPEEPKPKETLPRESSTID